MDKYNDANNFYRMPRRINDDFQNGKISTTKFLLLVIISMNANPVNGSFNTSYQGLTGFLKKPIKKNTINVAMRELRDQKYINYQSHQGRQGSFVVKVDNYPLSKGSYLDAFKTTSSEITTGVETDQSEDDTKLQWDIQKFNVKKKNLVKAKNMSSPQAQIRRSNNNNENEKYNN